MPSFDIVSTFNIQEVDNAVPSNTASTENQDALATTEHDVPIAGLSDNLGRLSERTSPINNDVKHGEKSDKVCTFYEKGTCKHGRNGKNCKFLHPKMCRKYLTHGNKKRGGCNKNDCPDHHRPMCNSSLKSETCFQTSCKRRHV